MPEQTDNHGWDIPTPDEDEEWGVILNEFFDGPLDREVILFGQSHERPAAGTDTPHLFFDTETEQLDYNDGTQWVENILTQYTDADAVAAIEAEDPLDLPGVLAMGDNAADPASAGEIVLNGTDVKVFTGGGVVNLSNVGSGGSGTATSVEDDTTEVTADVATLNFGTDLNVTDDGNDEVTVNSSASSGSTTTGRDVIDVDSHGADDTGGTASDTAFSDAVAAADAGDAILFKDGTYLLENTHVINKPLHLTAINATLERTTGATANTWQEDAMFTFKGGGTTGTSSALSADANAGDSVVSVTDASVFSEGDTVAVQSSGTYEEHTNSATTFAAVSNVDTTNDVLTLSTACRFDHVTGDSATVFQIEMLEDVRIEGFDCDGDGANTSSWIRLDFCESPVVENVEVSGFIYQGITFWNCWKPETRNCSVNTAYSEGSSEGEAFQSFKSQEVMHYRPETYQTRRGIDFTKGCADATIEQPEVSADGVAGIATHGDGSKGIVVNGGTVTDAGVNSAAILAAPGCQIKVTGTEVYADVRGLWNNNGELFARDVTVYAGEADSVTAQEALLVRGGTTDAEIAVEQDSTHYFSGQVVDVDGQNAVDRCRVVVDAEIYGNADGVNLQTNGADITDVHLSGTLDSQTDGNGNALWIRALNTGETISNVNVDDLDILGHGNWVVKVNGAGTVTDTKISNSTLSAGSTTAPAVAVDDASFDAFTEFWVTECTCTGGGTNDIEVNEPDADYVWITNNKAAVSVDSNATNVQETGNQP